MVEAEGAPDAEALGEKAKVEDLPDVPSKDPSDGGPAAKKQKSNEDGSF
jgi:hypothetical protein